MRRAFLVALVLFVAVLCVGLVAWASMAPEAREERTRASSIPADVVKWTPAMDRHPPVLHSELWTDPVPLPGPVNTAGAEDSPFVLVDGSALYFFFTPDVRKQAQEQLLDGVSGLWRSDWDGQAWSEPGRVWLQDPGKLALDGAAFVSGDEMWFASAREGYTGVNLFTAHWTGGEWASWSYAGQRIKELEVGEMHISSDGSCMYFHSGREGGKGGLDIWSMDRVGGEWQEPVNLLGVNSPGDEGWPYLSPDGEELWFTRTYLGSPGIFRSALANGSWSEPELVVSTFAGEPTLDAQGNLYFVHHYFQDGVMMEADIYVAYRR